MSRALIAVLCVLLWAAPAAAQATNRPVTMDDVIQLAQSGISAETIITFLDTRDIGFVPDPADIAFLRAAGVSEEVIRYLLQRTASVSVPVYPPPIPYPTVRVVPSYPIGSYIPRSFGGMAVSVGVPILPHWLREHYISHVTVGSLFGAGGVHVVSGRRDELHHGPSPFAVPFHPGDEGHGVLRVDAAHGGTLVGASTIHSAGTVSHGTAGHVTATHGTATHGTATHGTATHGGGHLAGGRLSGGVAGGHIGGGHGGGHAGH